MVCIQYSRYNNGHHHMDGRHHNSNNNNQDHTIHGRPVQIIFQDDHHIGHHKNGEFSSEIPIYLNSTEMEFFVILNQKLLFSFVYFKNDSFE